MDARIRGLIWLSIALLVAACGGGGGGGGSEPINTAPVAAFTATPNAGLAALTVSLNASDSRDSDGQITTYSWNFGDSSASGSGAVATHVFQNTGQYTVTLTVTDNRGATNSTSTTVTVRSIAAATRYGVKFLPFTGSEYQYMNPVAMNDSGHVVGEIDVLGSVGSRMNGFVYADGVTRELGTLGGSDSAAWGINNADTIVGFSLTPAGAQRAVRFEGGATIDLGTLAGDSAAFAINAAGQTVGSAFDGAGQLHAVVFESGAVTDIGTLGGVNAMAFAANDSGQIVGQSATAAGKVHAFLFRNGQMEDLGTLGGDESSAVDINKAGQILGLSQANFATGEPGYPYLVGFIYQNGVKTEIRPTTARDIYPSAINDLGQAIGLIAETDVLDGFPFVWHSSTGIRNLNDLIDPAIGCRLLTAVDINSSGQIVGGADCEAGRYPWDDSFITVLLTPES